MDQLLSCGEVAASLEGWSSVWLYVCVLVAVCCLSVCSMFVSLSLFER